MPKVAQKSRGLRLVTDANRHEFDAHGRHLPKPSTDFGGGGGGGGSDGGKKLDERRKTIHNEQMKLRATVLNTTAAGFVVAGMITPVTAATLGTAPPIASPNEAVALMLLWFVSAFILHNGGMLTLESTL